MSTNNNYFVLLSVIYNLQSCEIVSIELESDNLGGYSLESKQFSSLPGHKFFPYEEHLSPKTNQKKGNRDVNIGKFVVKTRN